MKRILIATLVSLLSLTLTIAQEDTCSTIVQEALSSTAENCNDVGQGEICFGYATIDIVVNCEDIPVFDSPGDIASLELVCSMQLGATQDIDSWGMALMQVPVNDTDLNATYLAFGDVWIQNAGSTFSQLDALIINDTDVYDGAGSHHTVIASLQVGQAINVIACNCTGNWTRMLLETGEVGWIPSRNVDVLGDIETLPDAESSTPLYQPMQAFVFRSGSQGSSCVDAPNDGILIQSPADADRMYIQINGVDIILASSIFVQSEPSGVLTIDVLDGEASVTVANFTALVSAGARAIIPMTENSEPNGVPHIEPYTVEDVANIPISLLPENIDPIEPLNHPTPVIIGIEPCAVVADQEATICPLYFLNPDGLPITQMDVEFVSAPFGDWQGSVHEPPQLLSGDYISGALAWNSTCSLAGGENFIGPVEWSITITDEAGHVSEPFIAQFNCVEG